MNDTPEKDLEAIERQRDEALAEIKRLRKGLKLIAKRYDGHKSMSECAMDAYDMACFALGLLEKNDELQEDAK